MWGRKVRRGEETRCFYWPCPKGPVCLKSLRLIVALLLYYCLRMPTGGYGVSVPMHYLPGALFGSKVHRNPQSYWGGILTLANLGLCPLYAQDVGKLRSYVLLYGLGANHLTISELRRAALHRRSNLIPPMRWRAKRGSEGYVFSMGPQLLHRLRISSVELTQRQVILLG
jgi:hypothetical protein